MYSNWLSPKLLLLFWLLLLPVDVAVLAVDVAVLAVDVADASCLPQITATFGYDSACCV